MLVFQVYYGASGGNPLEQTTLRVANKGMEQVPPDKQRNLQPNLGLGAVGSVVEALGTWSQGAITQSLDR